MADPHITDRQRAAFEHQLKELDRDPQTKCPGGASGSSGANKTVSTEEYNRLMQNARSERQKRFIEFLYTTGVRVSEMTGIQHADCKREGNVIAIRIRGKGNRKQSYKERTVWITKAMYERIRETFAGEEYLFETGKGRRYSRSYVSNQIAKLTQAVLGRKLSAHKLRHTFVTNKLNETGRVKAVSQYVGHSDVQITLRIYGHDTFSPADLLGPEAVA
jgi:integrase/recombinase XerD